MRCHQRSGRHWQRSFSLSPSVRSNSLATAIISAMSFSIFFHPICEVCVCVCLFSGCVVATFSTLQSVSAAYRFFCPFRVSMGNCCLLNVYHMYHTTYKRAARLARDGMPTLLSCYTYTHTLWANVYVYIRVWFWWLCQWMCLVARILNARKIVMWFFKWNIALVGFSFIYVCRTLAGCFFLHWIFSHFANGWMKQTKEKNILFIVSNKSLIYFILV